MNERARTDIAVEIKKISSLPYSRIRVQFMIAADKLDAMYQRSSKAVGKNVAIKGFRKGKVPPQVIERQFGDAIQQEMLRQIKWECFNAIEGDDNYRPLMLEEPRITMKHPPKRGEVATGEMECDVYPNVTVGAYQGLEVTVASKKVGVADVQEQLERFRNSRATLRPAPEPRPVRKGDGLLVDMWQEGPTGEAVGQRNGVHIVVDGAAGGAESEELIGANQHDIKKLTTGIVVRINGVYDRELPALDDQFAQDIDAVYQTLDQLKQGIREDLQHKYAQEVLDEKRTKLIAKIVEKSQIDLPQSMVRAEFNRMVKSTAERNNMDIKSFVDALEKDGRTIDGLFGNWKDAAERNLRETLALLQICKEQSIVVTDEHIDSYINEQLDKTQDGKQRAEMERQFADAETRDSVASFVRQQQVIAFLMDNNSVVLDDKAKG